jgi:hypothetical protein
VFIYTFTYMFIYMSFTCSFACHLHVHLHVNLHVHVPLHLYLIFMKSHCWQASHDGIEEVNDDLYKGRNFSHGYFKDHSSKMWKFLTLLPDGEVDRLSRKPFNLRTKSLMSEMVDCILKHQHLSEWKYSLLVSVAITDFVFIYRFKRCRKIA